MNITDMANRIAQLRSESLILEAELAKKLMDKKVRRTLNIENVFTVSDISCDDNGVELWIVRNGKGNWVSIHEVVYNEEDNQ